MAPRKKVSGIKMRLALEHAKRNGVNLDAVKTGPQMNVLKELLLSIARNSSTACVVEEVQGGRRGDERAAAGQAAARRA